MGAGIARVPPFPIFPCPRIGNTPRGGIRCTPTLIVFCFGSTLCRLTLGIRTFPVASRRVNVKDTGWRRQILAIHLRKARDAGPVPPEVNDAYLAQKTRGFSGADLTGLLRRANSFAIAKRRQRDPIEAPADAIAASPAQC